MIFHTIALAYLIASSDALLLRAGNDNRQEKAERGEKRKLKSNKTDDPCDAQQAMDSFALFGYSGQELMDLAAAAVDNCHAQMADAVRDDNCICPQVALTNYCPIRRELTEVMELNRDLEVLPPGQWCTSNAGCALPEQCMVSNNICVCARPIDRTGAMHMCESTDPQCGGGATIAP